MDTEEAPSGIEAAPTAAATRVVRRKISLPTKVPTASQLLGANIATPKIYWDRSHYDSPAAQLQALTKSSTLYIGNLAFSTRSSHVRALFSQIGPLKLVVVGLDRFKKTPCGFSFVEYRYQKDARLAIACLTGAKLDGRIVRVELDAGFKPGRQFGRGKSGGQVRDDRRTRDPDRMAQSGGGLGGALGASRGSKFTPPPQKPTSGSEALHWQPPEQSGGADVYGPGDPSATSGVKQEREETMQDAETNQ
jgi:nuclear cap-binding protein subunit 2